MISIANMVSGEEGRLLGVVGIDVPLEELAEDFLFFSEYMNTYAFLVDMSGEGKFKNL